MYVIYLADKKCRHMKLASELCWGNAEWATGDLIHCNSCLS